MFILTVMQNSPKDQVPPRLLTELPVSCVIKLSALTQHLSLLLRGMYPLPRNGTQVNGTIPFSGARISKCAFSVGPPAPGSPSALQMLMGGAWTLLGMVYRWEKLSHKEIGGSQE